MLSKPIVLILIHERKKAQRFENYIHPYLYQWCKRAGLIFIKLRFLTDFSEKLHLSTKRNSQLRKIIYVPIHKNFIHSSKFNT